MKFNRIIELFNIFGKCDANHSTFGNNILFLQDIFNFGGGGTREQSFEGYSGNVLPRMFPVFTLAKILPINLPVELKELKLQA